MTTLYIGVLGISLTITYAFWVRVRVFRLQQDVYDIRDWLFDQACNLEAQDDQAYRETREFLNNLVSVSANLSVPVMIYLVSRAAKYSTERKSTTVNQKLQEVIDYAIRKTAERVAKYLTRETLTGVLINAVVSGGHLRIFYVHVLTQLFNGKTSTDIINDLRGDSNYAYLQPAESPYEGVSPTRYSTQVKSGLIIKQLLPNSQKCAICKGFVPTQAMSIDHIQRKEDGGSSLPENAQITHPYCNTGYKEL